MQKMWYIFLLLHPHPVQLLVGGGCGEGGGSETNPLIGGIEHGVEALEESEPVDEVKTLAAVGSKIVDNEVDAASNSTDVSVEGTGPELTIGSQLEGTLTHKKISRENGVTMQMRGATYSAGDEEQALQACQLCASDAEKAGSAVENTTGCGLVLGECVSSNENKGCACWTVIISTMWSIDQKIGFTHQCRQYQQWWQEC